MSGSTLPLQSGTCVRWGRHVSTERTDDSLFLWRPTSSLPAWTMTGPQVKLLESWVSTGLAHCQCWSCDGPQCVLLFPGQMLLRAPFSSCTGSSEGYRASSVQVGLRGLSKSDGGAAGPPAAPTAYHSHRFCSGGEVSLSPSPTSAPKSPASLGSLLPFMSELLQGRTL